MSQRLLLHFYRRRGAPSRCINHDAWVSDAPPERFPITMNPQRSAGGNQPPIERMMNDGIENVLRKAPLFASLNEAEMGALRRRVSRKTYHRGETLFSEQDACQGLFVVGRGKVRIFKISASGREQILSIEGPGSSFAELPVFDGGNYPASAAALEESEVLFVSRKAFQDFCREHPEVALKVIAVVGSRLRRLIGIIEELSFTTVRQRLIALIVRLAQASSTHSSEGVHVALNKTQQDMAAELGTVRELV